MVGRDAALGGKWGLGVRRTGLIQEKKHRAWRGRTTGDSESPARAPPWHGSGRSPPAACDTGFFMGGGKNTSISTIWFKVDTFFVLSFC